MPLPVPARRCRVLALAAVLGLTACAGAVSTQRISMTSAGTVALLRTDAGPGPVDIARLGTPFPGAEARTDAVIADAFSNARPIYNFDFAVIPRDAAEGAYVVLAFAPPGARPSGAGLCRGETPSPDNGAAPGAADVLGAVCLGARRVAEARGQAAGFAGPDDPGFRDLMRQLARALVDERKITGDN